MGIWGKVFVIAGFLAVAACEELAVAPPAADSEPATSVQGPSSSSEIVGVATVTDGDTIEIHGQAIRIHGVDAPERGKRCGEVNVYQQASLALSDFTAGQTVSCSVNGRDGEREVATCTVGGFDIAEHTTRAGWTRDWPRYSDRAYADEEAEARAAGRGMWGLSCAPDVWSGRNYE